jgi:hypothetical protein
MAHEGDTSGAASTADKDYNLIRFTGGCLSNALRLTAYLQDAERAGDRELADLFRRAREHSLKGAEDGKELLARRLAKSGRERLPDPSAGLG